MDRYFTIDGVGFRVDVMELKRGFSITDTEHSGRSMNDEMHRDIIGTYYNYTVKIVPNSKYREDYDRFYDIISAPTPFHSVEFPYGQNMLIFQAYVTNGEDTLTIREESGLEISRWDGLSINFVAKEPQRRP